jgi:hypothetical protein
MGVDCGSKAAQQTGHVILILEAGFGTFRGKNAGVWPPLKALKVLS